MDSFVENMEDTSEISERTVKLANYDYFCKATSMSRQALMALKSDYDEEMHAARELNTSVKDGIRLHIEKGQDRIALALGEVTVLQTLAEYLQYLEVDKLRVDLMTSCLSDESEWLKAEYLSLYEKTSAIENSIAATESEKAYFMSMYERRKNETAITTKKQAAVYADEKDDDNGDIPLHLRAVYNLILEYSSQGRYEVAIGLCNRAISDIKSSKGENLDLAVMLNILALVYREKGDLKEATNTLELTVKIREKLLGPTNPMVAATLNNLSVLLGKRGKFKEAEPVCRKALKIREQNLGPHHCDVAKQLNNLALILQNLKKNNEIEDLYKRAILIYTDTPEKTDANLLKTQNNLAAFYIRTQNYTNAINVLRLVLSKHHEELFVRGLIKGTKPIFVFVDIAVSQGMKLLEIQEKFPNFGNIANPVVKISLRYYASVCKRLGKEREAVALESYLEWCNNGGETRYHHSKEGPVEKPIVSVNLPEEAGPTLDKLSVTPLESENSQSSALTGQFSEKSSRSTKSNKSSKRKKWGLFGIFK